MALAAAVVSWWSRWLADTRFPRTLTSVAVLAVMAVMAMLVFAPACYTVAHTQF
ncbi:hypothetical protein KZZ52_58740 [Dactylosporangium sp. AC04546]|uniref:hypothetical protein n=1 Tax=Dactylosporangium sp. AC04546 TaxID=2862460 RepID=UPI001EDEE037|nr:hypothetical protein [Dactylosporangium sp. AC04546]WVK83631.1 hypothetical protein KZZ52_58740 [Dactylosporangium sp. AC04546]